MRDRSGVGATERASAVYESYWLLTRTNVARNGLNATPEWGGAPSYLTVTTDCNVYRVEWISARAMQARQKGTRAWDKILIKHDVS
jgi:hypothetical protein